MLLHLALLFLTLFGHTQADDTNLREVNFRTMRGTARATSIWASSYDYRALRGFAQPGYTWHSAKYSTLPQSIWYEFPQALRVMKYSFQSRTDHKPQYIISNGPSRYAFWGSNSINCSNSENRVILVEDLSDTPFSLKNTPKVEDVDNTHSYRCYGFTIFATPGHSDDAAISNIRLFYAEAEDSSSSSCSSTCITLLVMLLVVALLVLILLSVYAYRLCNQMGITVPQFLLLK